MKNIKQIVFSTLLLTFLFTSCEDFEEVKTPNFEVGVKQSIAVGEEVEFTIENAPNFLSFYSGEFGKEYQYRDRTNIEGTVNMSFDCAQNYQNGTSRSNPGLSIQYSTDYDGSGTAAAIAASNWTDISDKFILPTNRTYEWTNSGIGDITDLAAEGQSVYIAFKILAEGKTSEGNRQGEYRFNNFVIDLSVAGKTTTLPVTDLESTEWQTVNVQGSGDANTNEWIWWSNDFFRMNGTSAYFTNEDWLITDKINLTAVLPDQAISLKSYSERLESFKHIYSEAGVYTVTFVGNNTTVYGNEEDVKELTIEVLE
ncbi:DUF5017 domain-containing protein [Polaribacter undariae]|uniref:DUF5017 domain-containing protein n=1 Tax=Polaribacter sejongensis TaxID=985043 RepID=A0AAJ1QX87_9FLAO|nr:DUF5017 domain-containing protein [Polaribacter undariae]MDN3619578.1 DUF5017 domain-containing protein [Polaribacter undariae]UWD32308.1 DUF5017 domain-containing protein [Polaribacter undariae]